MLDHKLSKTAPYDLVGGSEGLKEIVTRFYALMETEPEFARLRAMHAADLSHARQMLFEFLSGWLGGPPLYFLRSDRRCIMAAHRQLAIGREDVQAWLGCMYRAFKDCGVETALHDHIFTALARFAWSMAVGIPDPDT